MAPTDVEETQKFPVGGSMFVLTDGSFGPNTLDYDSDRIREAHGIVGRITYGVCVHTYTAPRTKHDHVTRRVEKGGIAV